MQLSCSLCLYTARSFLNFGLRHVEVRDRRRQEEQRIRADRPQALAGLAEETARKAVCGAWIVP